ncbi:exonuclease SbcCD subunit D [Gemmatimonadota bacterium]
MIKFIHTADLHLDSPFVGLKNMAPAIAGAMQEATFGAFDSVIELCLDQEVDFLVVAGDIYDGADRSLRAQLRFRDGLRRLAEKGIRSFVAHGNHDPLDGWTAGLELPEEVVVFPGDRVETVPVVKDGREVARITGISYPVREVRENLLPKFNKGKGNAFTIGVLHCNLGSDTGHEPYAPCTLRDLEKKEFDYWALGHVHNRAEHRLNNGSLVVYPGNTQGRSIRETGERGAVIVTVDDSGTADTSFFPVDRVRWETVTLDISKMDKPDRLYEALEEAVEESRDASGERSLCLRISLEGRGDIHNILSKPGELGGLEEDLRRKWQAESPFVWLDCIQDRTRGTIDLEARRRSGDFVAGMIDQFETLAGGLPDKEAEIRELLAPVFEKNKTARKYLQPPDNDKLKQLLERARELCLDCLVTEEDQ